MSKNPESSRKARRASRSRVDAPQAIAIPVAPISSRRWWLILALVATTVLVYLPALNAPFVLDDERAIEASAAWSAPKGSAEAGRPVVVATLGINYAINRALGVDQSRDPDGPNKAIGYRLFNIVIHLLTGALVFGVIRRAVRERAIPEDWHASADAIAGIVCALWLLHPIQSEVINYVVQRSEGLASLFYIATLYFSQRAWEGDSRTRLRWSVLAVCSCALGIASKEIAISAPLAVMLYDRAFRLPSWRALAMPENGRAWLYVALWCACLVPFALFVHGARGDSAGTGGSMTWYAYLYTQCWAIAHYLRLVIWPSSLSIDYGYRTIHDRRGIPGLVLLVASGIAVLFAWTRAQRFGWIAFAGSCFFMLLAPSSSVVPIVLEVAAERRMYLPLAPVLVVLVVGVEWMRRRVAAKLPAIRLGWSAVAIAAVLAVATAARSWTYFSSEALWRSAATAVPGHSRAFGQLGWALFRAPTPNLVAADSAFTKAFAVDSECPGKCLEYATLQSNEGHFAEAVPLLERQLEWDPGEVLAERLLAYDLMKLGEFSRAVASLEDIVQRDPTESHFVALGVAELSAGHPDEAIATFRAMAAFSPDDEQLRALSQRLEEGATHPEALQNLQEFAYWTARGWM